MDKFKQIIINKNRGWRGLAEAIVRDETAKTQLKMIFSFSQPVWNDLIINHRIVLQDKDYYYVIKFKDELNRLPRPTQQRSVLIKNFYTSITEVTQYAKTDWRRADAYDWNAIVHFLRNKNNHTTSDWNCIGVRVIPEI